MNENALPPDSPQSLYRPVWADPGFILSTNEFRYEDFTLTGPGIIKVASNNPKRWALGFVALTTGGTLYYVGPWNDPNDFRLTVSETELKPWVTIFTHGPMLVYEWYCAMSAAGTIRVVELEAS